MEYDNKGIDLLLDKKFIECSAFKSKYKDLYKNIKKKGRQNKYVYPIHMCGNKDSNKEEIINHVYEMNNEYDGYSFSNKDGKYGDGFTDNIQEALSVGFDIPGWPTIPGIPSWHHPGWCTAPLSKTDCGWDGCCNRCCSARCGGCSHCWIRDESTCYSPWDDAATPPTPGIPGIHIGFDVPSIEDLYRDMKNKLDSAVVEPFSGYQITLVDGAHEALHSFFEDNTKEILAIILFCIMWIISTMLTENRLIILLVSSFIASLFYICIRDLNGIVYTLDKPEKVISEALT
jgi:hypothetical protein